MVEWSLVISKRRVKIQKRFAPSEEKSGYAGMNDHTLEILEVYGLGALTRQLPGALEWSEMHLKKL